MARRGRRISPEEQSVRDTLKVMEYESEKIAERVVEGVRTCDLRAWNAKDRLWVEVKSRTGDQVMRSKLQKGELACKSRPMGYQAQMASILAGAVKQLDTLAREEDGFEIIWLLLLNPMESDIYFQQAIGTAYGIEDILEMTRDNKLRPCYFFGESTFFTHKQLDALVVVPADLKLPTMCVNPHATRAARFRETQFFNFFQTLADATRVRVLIDPAEEEKAGRGFIADCAIDRRDKPAVLAYVEKKYGLKNPLNLVLDEHVAATLVERPDP